MQPAVVYVTTNEIMEYARGLNSTIFGDSHWPSLYQLWMKESGWNPYAVNAGSGACGIAQFLPCRAFGDYKVEISEGLKYIQARYGNPTNAYQHSLALNWY